MASGDILAEFSALNSTYAGTKPALVESESDALVLSFEDAADTFCQFSSFMDSRYTNSGITVKALCYMETATTGDVALEASIRKQASGDAQNRAFTAVNSSGAVTVPGTAGNLFLVSVSFTDGADMDNVGPGDAFDIKLQRDSGLAGDAAGDLKVKRFWIEES